MSDIDEKEDYYANIVVQTEMVGMSYYMVQGITNGASMTVDRDSSNQVDMWAIKVMNKEDKQVGYVRSEHSILIAPIMDFIKHYDTQGDAFISVQVCGDKKWTDKGHAYPLQICFSVGKWLEKQIMRTLNTFGLEYEVHFIIP